MAESGGPSESSKSTIKKTSSCQVCGDDATINNYGARSCLSCRTFFRRNAYPKKEVPICRFDGFCDVTIATRKTCTACRLAKCISIGMSPDLIRKEDLAATKRKSGTAKTEEVTVMTPSQPTSVDIQDGDNHPHLTPADQTLISNILYAYEAFSPVAEIRHRIEILTTSASNFPCDVSQSLSVMSLFYNSLHSFISSTPDFQILTPTEQSSLFQRNMLGLLCIGEMYLMRESGIFDKPENEMILLPLYGAEVVQQAKTICQQLDGDPVLFKLMLVALAFSSNCYMLHNRGNIDKDSLLLGTFRLLGSQNVYVELTWKYLTHTYDYNIAVQKFSTLVKQLLDTLKFSMDLYENNPIHQAFIDDAIAQTEKSLVANNKAVVPLWGKK